LNQIATIMGAILSTNKESKDYHRSLYSIILCRNVCCKCNVHFKTKISLDEHMQEVHAETSYICHYCNSISKTWFTFQQHIYAFHNDIVFCSYCYKAYSDYSSLFLHWKTHGKNLSDIFVRTNNSYGSNICII